MECIDLTETDDDCTPVKKRPLANRNLLNTANTSDERYKQIQYLKTIK